MNDAQSLFLAVNQHLLHDEKPSNFLNYVSGLLLFRDYPFSMLERLKYTKQTPIYHPEGNVWNHVMMVIDQAAKFKVYSQDPAVFMWAALLHDIGKPGTSREKKGKITSYNHDKLGEKLACEFLFSFTSDLSFVESVSALVRWHMQILFVVKGRPLADVEKMKKDVNVQEVALLGLCDRLGRTQVDDQQEYSNIQKFLEKVNL
ncbi:MAG: Multifunctional CCA protein [Eubacteriales bacterium SKADARSKE-1]|nr:Multifunctional CCA protein [Eubacteriales bacterium SKADARSKE-1]